MKSYYRIMAGPKSYYAELCHAEGFIGVDHDIKMDLTGRLKDDWREFNKEFRPIWLKEHPGKSKISAGLACGMIHTVCKSMKEGDIVLTPDGNGNYHIGEITSDYRYHAGGPLQHRRKVSWYREPLDRNLTSIELQNSAGSIGTVSNLTKYAKEIELLLSGNRPNLITTQDETIENVTEFALEQHLEAFLVKNWANTELGKEYDIFQEEDELVGQQYQTDTGYIDILAISKDRKKLLVVELKKGRASDSVVGQIQRYMGYVQSELSDEDQTVAGVIIALEDDLRIQRALEVARNIEFYKYQLTFKLTK